MRALVQRVSEASVSVAGQQIGSINGGLLVFVCAMEGDAIDCAEKLAAKISKLRIFRDEQDRMNRSLIDAGGEALIISQFTLAADTRRGNRPGFSAAAAPAKGEAMYQMFIEAMRQNGVTVATGRFGADMAVSLINDGPVTIWLDTEA